MARSINFQYKYPYSVFFDKSRFRMAFDTFQTTLTGNYTYALTFQTTTPYIIKAKITITATNTTGVSVLNRGWYLYLLAGNTWRTLVSFNMPANGVYTWEGAVNIATCQKFAAVPNAQMAAGTTWTLSISIDEMTVQETVTTTDFVTTDYHALFPNYGGVAVRPTWVYANIGGTLTAVKGIQANIGGVLTNLTSAYSGAYTTTAPDSYRVYEFTPPSTATYKIEVFRNSGYHEAWLYNSAFTDMNSGNAVNDGSFSLTGGSLYYIYLTHAVYYTDTADSVLFITKTS